MCPPWGMSSSRSIPMTSNSLCACIAIATVGSSLSLDCSQPPPQIIQFSPPSYSVYMLLLTSMQTLWHMPQSIFESGPGSELNGEICVSIDLLTLMSCHASTCSQLQDCDCNCMAVVNYDVKSDSIQSSSSVHACSPVQRIGTLLCMVAQKENLAGDIDSVCMLTNSCNYVAFILGMITS